MLIAVATPLFPRAAEPYRGWPIYKTVQALESYADVRVFSPFALYPSTEKPVVAPLSNHRLQHPPVYVEYPAIPLLSRPWNDSVCARNLYPHLKGLRPDVILNYWLYPEGSAALRVARALGIPAIVGSRGSDLRWIQDPVTKRLVSKTVRNADYVLTVSEELRQRAIQMGAAAERTAAVLNGCDPEIFFYRDLGQARQKLGLPVDARTILYVGRLSKQKGLQELCDAFAILAREQSNMKLVFLGSGPYREKILSAARSGGLENRIVITGDQGRHEVAEWMRAADLLCLPSYSEGCPNVVIEAIACGCPVVATDVGGTTEIVNQECSILVPPRDPERLAAGLREGLARRWDRQRIGAVYNRTWDRVARETYEVCEKVVKPSSSRKRRVYRSRQLRITVVTSYFPDSASTYRGHSAFHTIQKLKDMADVTVLCPLATRPGAKWTSRETRKAVDPKLRLDDVHVTYFRYPIIPLLTRPINGFLCKNRLLPLLRAAGTDVVLNYWLYPEGYAAVQAGSILGIPVVAGSIGSDLRQIKDPFTEYFVKRTLHEAAGVITVSDELRRCALELGAAPEKVVSILNGHDESMFCYRGRGEARRELGLGEEGELVLYVGNILKSKGMAELADGFADVAKRRPAARLAIIGEGPFAEAFENRMKAHEVLGRVQMLGRQPSAAVAAWMRAADLLCLPSYSEGCPNVVVEALGSGCPVVATAVGGIPELVDQRCGILVPPQDAARLAEALESALARSWDRPGIAAKLHRGWDVVAEEVFAVCCNVANGQTARAAVMPAISVE